MQEHRIARRCEGLERGDEAAEHAVLVSDMLRFEPGHAVAVALPGNDALEVLVPRIEITEVGFLHARGDGILDGGEHREVHIGHPHGDGVEPLLRGLRGTGRAQTVDGHRVLPVALHDACEIVGHSGSFARMMVSRRELRAQG